MIGPDAEKGSKCWVSSYDTVLSGTLAKMDATHALVATKEMEDILVRLEYVFLDELAAWQDFVEAQEKKSNLHSSWANQGRDMILALVQSQEKKND